MIPLADLWLPILLAAVIPTVAAALLWKVFPPLAAQPRAEAGYAGRLGAFFVLALVVAVLIGYVMSRSVDPTPEYWHVWRIAGTIGMLAYGAGHVAGAVTGSRSWAGAWREVAHGIVYGLLVAGSFGGFWPDR